MKRIMPLWFLDIVGTEEKINKLAAEGKRLSGFSPAAGVFSFEQGEKEEAIYRICRLKNCNGEPPKGLVASGWEKVCGSRNIYVVKNLSTQTESIPSYKYWKTLNRVLIIIAVIIICGVGGTFFGMLAASMELGRSITENRLFFTSTAAFTLLVIIIAYLGAAHKKLTKNDTDLNLKGVIRTIPEENFIYTPKQEKEMLKNKTMMKKAPLGWFYSPDKVESMVEKLAAEGWKFYRFNKLGTVFYFIKSVPCKLKFVVDFQTVTSDEYFAHSKEDGWKLEFTSIVRTTSYIIWSKEYEDEAPEFYSDPETMVKRAKKTAFTVALPLILMAALLIAIFVTIISEMQEEPSSFLMGLAAFYTVLIAEYGIFAAKSIGYYIRTKNKYHI